MTANYSADPARFLSEQLERDEPDLLRSLLQTFIDALMGGYAIALWRRYGADGRSGQLSQWCPVAGVAHPGPGR